MFFTNAKVAATMQVASTIECNEFFAVTQACQKGAVMFTK